MGETERKQMTKAFDQCNGGGKSGMPRGPEEESLIKAVKGSSRKFGGV